jgi:hypothetical protein
VPLSFAFRLAHPAEYRVHRDPVQPGRKLALAAKPDQLAPGLYERFLRAVLGLADIAGHPQAQAVNLAHVQSVKGFESACVLAPRPLDEASLFGGRCRLYGLHTPTIVAGPHGQKRFQVPFLPFSCLLDALPPCLV